MNRNDSSKPAASIRAARAEIAAATDIDAATLTKDSQV